MKRLTMLVLVGWAAVASAQMRLMDDFSTDTSNKYDKLTTYGGGYAYYARNSTNQFEPQWYGSADSTVHWIWNQGEGLKVGESVSLAVRLDDTFAAYNALGIIVYDSGLSYTRWMWIQKKNNDNNAWYEDFDTTPPVSFGVPQTGWSTITVTRVTAAGLFDCRVRGGGLNTNQSYNSNVNLSSVPSLKFGIAGYKNVPGSAGMVDDLRYGVPHIIAKNEGNEDPTVGSPDLIDQDPAWILAGGGTYSVSGGSEVIGSKTWNYWKLTTSGGSSYAHYKLPEDNSQTYRHALYGSNWVMQARMRLVDAGNPHRASIGVQDGTDVWYVGLRNRDGTEGVYYLNSSGGYTLIKAMDVDTDYHTYKMTMRRGPTDEVDVYIDGVLETTLTRPQVFNWSTAGVYWGDAAGAGSANVEVRYNYVHFSSLPPPPAGSLFMIR